MKKLSLPDALNTIPGDIEIIIAEADPSKGFNYNKKVLFEQKNSQVFLCLTVT